MLKLLRYLKPYWWQVLILVVAIAIQVISQLQLPALMANIINDIASISEGAADNAFGAIWRDGGIMLALAALAAVMSVVSDYFSAKVGACFSRDVRADFFAKVLSLNLADLKNYSTASLITRTTNDVSQVQMVVTIILSMMLRAPLFCIFGVIMAVRTAPDMTWIIALGVVAVLTSVSVILFAVMPKFRIFQKMIDRITMLTRENLTGLKVIRAFNNDKLEQHKFARTNKDMTKLLISVGKILELQNPLINIIFNGTTLLCIWVGISFLGAGDMSYLGNMIAFSEYVTNIMMSFLMLSMLFVMLPRANVSAARINQVLHLKDKIRYPKRTKGVPAKKASVEFKNVSFNYPDAAEKVLDNISFTAKTGETTAFVGSTGSGKSTLINLVPRFYEASSGEILINGLKIQDYSKDDLMRRIGLVPQRGMLFAGTVMSNIRFGAPDASERQVEKAAQIAQAEEFIKKMPEGYHSHIAQSGSNVSGGQKQRLSIARAICKDPDIYIFDDAFSALDVKTDAKLREALRPVTDDAVVLIVAQRIHTIKNAEQIIVLDKGKMVGRGTHLELLNSCEVYQSIVRSQLSDDEWKQEMKLAKSEKKKSAAKTAATANSAATSEKSVIKTTQKGAK